MQPSRQTTPESLSALRAAAGLLRICITSCDEVCEPGLHLTLEIRNIKSLSSHSPQNRPHCIIPPLAPVITPLASGLSTHTYYLARS
jgi:hypothetical protein